MKVNNITNMACEQGDYVRCRTRVQEVYSKCPTLKSIVYVIKDTIQKSMCVSRSDQ